MALHPLLSVLVRRPDLVLAHLAGYATLIREEASATGTAIVRRALAWAIALFSFTVFLVLAGVAAMLAALHAQVHWVLLLVPGIALALSGLALVQARQRLPDAALSELRSQLDADIETLRTLGSA